MTTSVEPPEWLPDDAAEVFRDLVRDCAEANVFADRVLLSLYAQVLAELRLIDRHLEAEGPDSRPLLETQNGLLAVMLTLSDELGLNPLARLKRIGAANRGDRH